MKPVVKWAGGKTQLLDQIRRMTPPKFDKYYEPFLGGGAVLLALTPTVAIVNDLNAELINMYLQIKTAPENVIEELARIDDRHTIATDQREYFYSVREIFNGELNTGTPEQAARLIYINKHCFNGLYRVNSRGLFNVSFNNNSKGKSCDEHNIRQIASYLQHVEILTGDFSSALVGASSGDFVFLDSPYAPLNPTSFASYTKEGFNFEDHVKLAELFKSLTNRGIYCMLTNHNTELIRTLYRGYWIRAVPVARNINSKAAGRRGEEVIITNYAPPMSEKSQFFDVSTNC